MYLIFLGEAILRHMFLFHNFFEIIGKFLRWLFIDFYNFDNTFRICKIRTNQIIYCKDIEDIILKPFQKIIQKLTVFLTSKFILTDYKVIEFSS